MKTKHFTLIFYISLVLSLLGLFAEVYTLNYNYEDPNLFLLSIVSKFKSIYVNIGLENLSFNIYNIIFYVLLFFGSLFFYFSKGKETRLLKLFYSVVLITSIFWIFYSILRIILYPERELSVEESPFQYYINIVVNFIVNIIYLLLSYWFLKLLSQNSLLIKVINEKSNTINFTNSKKVERLIHLLIDSLIIIFLFSSIASLFYYLTVFDKNFQIPEFLNSRFTIYFLTIILSFIYYPFFEFLFGATPGKFLTSSRIVNSKAEDPSLINIFLRTLYRQIPFDALSFFGVKGWHDSLSETYVVKENNTRSYSIYIILLVVASFSVAIYLAVKDLLSYYF